MSYTNNISALHIKTFFSCMKTQFPDVENSKIETEQFLEAAKEVVGLVEKLGKIFAPVKYDMNNNIDKIYSVYEKDKSKYEFLNDLVMCEKQENLAIDALLWLRRALQFILKFFESIIESYQSDTLTDNLEKLLKTAYTETLMPYHKWLTQQLFHILCKMCLTRQQFFQILACNGTACDDIVIKDMENFNVNLRKCVEDLTSFYIDNQLENVARV